MFVHGWLTILWKSWSIRFSALAGVFATTSLTLQVILPSLEGILSPTSFMTMTLISVLLATVSRLIDQPQMQAAIEAEDDQ